MLFGQTQELPPSRFIREIDPEYIESIGASRRSFADDGHAAQSAQQSTRTGAGTAGQPSTASHPFGSTVFGAPRQAPASSAAANENLLTPETIDRGMSVRHPRFGKGTVMSVEKVAGDALVCVAFENKTTRNMLVRQAKLEKG